MTNCVNIPLETLQLNGEQDNAFIAEANQKIFTPQAIVELNGPKGLEPTRYGDWERQGKCVDF